MQIEFDKEHDDTLQRQAHFANRNNLVSVSYDKFKNLHPLVDEAESSLDHEHTPDVESSSESEDELETMVFGRGGVSGKGDQMVSKHDALLSSKNNAHKMMRNFPSEFDTGDSHAMDMRLSNRVFNSLRT